MASKRERENAAANAVVQQLTALTGAGRRHCVHNDNSRDHMHDFTITTEADTIALEVTTTPTGTVWRDHRWDPSSP